MNEKQCEEEQRDEIEALQAIYADEFVEISENSFEINLSASVDFGVNDDGPKAVLRISLPPMYPQEKPTIKLKNVDGVSSDVRKKIQNDLEMEALDNLGSVQIFALAESAKAAIQDHSSLDEGNLSKYGGEPGQGIDIDKYSCKASSLFISKNAETGTPVTAETFSEWNTEFLKEIEESEKKEETNEKKSNSVQRKGYVKLTGRQLFEGDSSLVQSDSKIIESQEVDWTLFSGDDLDDEDDGILI